MNVNHKDGESEKGRGGEAVTVAVDAKKDGRPLQTRIGAESDAADGLQASQSQSQSQSVSVSHRRSATPNFSTIGLGPIPRSTPFVLRSLTFFLASPDSCALVLLLKPSLSPSNSSGQQSSISHLGMHLDIRGRGCHDALQPSLCAHGHEVNSPFHTAFLLGQCSRNQCIPTSAISDLSSFSMDRGQACLIRDYLSKTPLIVRAPAEITFDPPLDPRLPQTTAPHLVRHRFFFDSFFKSFALLFSLPSTASTSFAIT